MILQILKSYDINITKIKFKNDAIINVNKSTKINEVIEALLEKGNDFHIT